MTEGDARRETATVVLPIKVKVTGVLVVRPPVDTKTKEGD
jgi:hypothetical protein